MASTIRAQNSAHLTRLIDDGFTVAQICEAWGISTSSFKAWEKGGDAPFYTICLAECLQHRRGHARSRYYVLQVPNEKAKITEEYLSAIGCSMNEVKRNSN